jgi:hypothetical protein
MTEQRITLSLATLTFASSILAVLTLLLIPFDTGYLIAWPFTLILVIVPICLILGIYLVLRKTDHLGFRLAGLITIMVGVWILGMAGFALLDFLLVYIQSPFWPVAGILYMVGWLALWHFATRLYFRYEMGKNKVVNQLVS